MAEEKARSAALAASISGATPLEEKLVRGTVARGRTVYVPSKLEMVVVGIDPETNKPRYVPKLRAYGPGEEVTLPESEMALLRANEFIVDPNKVVVSGPAEGSHVKEMG